MVVKSVSVLWSERMPPAMHIEILAYMDDVGPGQVDFGRVVGGRIAFAERDFPIGFAVERDFGPALVG